LVYAFKILCDLPRGEHMVSVLPVGEVVAGEVGADWCQSNTEKWSPNTYPDIITSSSMPYSFICCKPQPSLSLFGTTLFRRPVRFGVWNIRISTRGSPNSSTRGVSSEAQHGFGASLVPRRPSVRIDTRRSGFLRRASRIVAIY
jgi:hypothetical protein